MANIYKRRQARQIVLPGKGEGKWKDISCKLLCFCSHLCYRSLSSPRELCSWNGTSELFFYHFHLSTRSLNIYLFIYSPGSASLPSYLHTFSNWPLTYPMRLMSTAIRLDSFDILSPLFSLLLLSLSTFLNFLPLARDTISESILKICSDLSLLPLWVSNFLSISLWYMTKTCAKMEFFWFDSGASSHLAHLTRAF